MSERLTPEQQREMRVRMGAEVQGIAESVSGYTQLPRDPDKIPLAELVKVPIVEKYHELPKDIVIGFLAKVLSEPYYEVTTEDRLRGAIVEACTWLQQGAPGCALQVLENALKL